MSFDPFKEKPDEAEDWLVSYADMMTLIACFFILMVSFANFEEVGFNIKAEQLSQHFRKDKFKSSNLKLQFLREEITKHESKVTMTKVSVKDSELIINFSGSTLFANGQTMLKGKELESLDSLIEIIKANNTQYRILIEGHADDELKGTKYSSQWAMSAARSAAVIERFQYYGFNAKNLTAIAKGDTDKVTNSTDKDGKRVEESATFNRRVLIRVLEPLNKEKVKMGFGVYFKDSRQHVSEELTDDETKDYKRE